MAEIEPQFPWRQHCGMISAIADVIWEIPDWIDEHRGFTWETKMKKAAFGLVVVLLFGIASAAQAGDKEDVLAAMNMWKESLAVGTSDSPDKILALYADDAVLWGTISPKIRPSPDLIRDYFVNAYQKLPKLTVEFSEPHVRIYDNVALNSGYYTFTYEKDGQQQVLPARYSFALVKHGGAWLIADHHSSAMPK